MNSFEKKANYILTGLDLIKIRELQVCVNLLVFQDRYTKETTCIKNRYGGYNKRDYDNFTLQYLSLDDVRNIKLDMSNMEETYKIRRWIIDHYAGKNICIII